MMKLCTFYLKWMDMAAVGFFQVIETIQPTRSNYWYPLIGFEMSLGRKVGFRAGFDLV